MSHHIEWADLDGTEPRLGAPGEYSDGFGNQNDRPALMIGDGAILEGELDQWRAFAIALLDSVNEYEADEAGEGTPGSVTALVTAARKALAVRGRDSARLIHTEKALRALLDALDPQTPKEK